MFICSECFSDIELKSHIESLSTKNGDCAFCGAKATPLLSSDELLDFFEELFGLYQVDSSGVALTEKIENDWNLFSNHAVAEKLVPELLKITSFSDWEFDISVRYIDEISDNISYWEKLKDSLKWERRFLMELENIKDLGWDSFFKDQIEFTETDELCRARIHTNEGEPKLPTHKMGRPDREKVNVGRGNPQGIPYLYLSMDPVTTLYETRALLHDEVSIGDFRVRKGELLNIVDFTEIGRAFRGIGNLINHTKAVRLKELIGDDLSKPIRRYDSDLEYVPTQFICEFIRYVIGADGILFNSSLHKGGKNVVLFDQAKVECTNVKKCLVTDLTIQYEEIV